MTRPSWRASTACNRFARLACERRYVRPVLDDGKRIDIRSGRHPVIETLMPVGGRSTSPTTSCSTTGSSRS